MSTTNETLAPYLREGTPAAVVERYIALEQIAQDSNFGVLDNNVVVVDTEATGLSYTKDELIQIAAARIVDGKVSDWYVTFVNPNMEISEDIEHLTHISNDDVANAPQVDEALSGLVDFVGDSVLLAHNVSFDKTFLTKHATGYPLLNNIWVDTLDLVRIVFPRLTSHRLIDLAKAFGVQESTHRADDDVATTCLIYRLVLAAVTQMPYELIKIIANLASLEQWSTSYIFKEMLKFIQKTDIDIDSVDKEENVEVDIFGEAVEKVNSFSILKKMRSERFINLPIQKKYDIELKDQELFPTNVDMEIKAQATMQFPTESDLEIEFTNDGLLGKIYSDYEQRDEQIEMSKDVLAAFRDAQNLAIEAGTGVGKSMAYLIPAIKLAKENQITVGVATKTNSLLDQLIYHELPYLAKEIDGLVYSSLKGAKHYICLKKAAILAKAKAKMVTFKDQEFCNAPSVAGLLSYIEQTTYDDCDGLKINGRALPFAAYTSASHECMHHKCPFYHNGCFVHGARKLAKNSDIVVTNHSMLLCDAKANNGLLPPIKYWIIDEAHGLETEARRAFSSDVLAATLLEFGKNLASDSHKLNVFERARLEIDTSSLSAKEDASMDYTQLQECKNMVYGLIGKCISCGRDLASKSDLFANNICDLLDFAEKNSFGYEFSNLWVNDQIRESEQFNNLWKIAKEWTCAAENLLTQSSKLLTFLEDFKSIGIISNEISAFSFELKETLNACDLFFFNNSQEYVYSANINTKKTIKQDKLICEPYSVCEKLVENLYSRCNSIVFTSATLALGDSFASYLESVGLDVDTRTKQLSSSYDYDNNMKIYIANDMPDPNSNAYLERLELFLSDLHIAGSGSILSLFTNRRQMEHAYEYVSENIKNHGLRLLMQKWGLSVKGVKDEFLADEKLSLFALKSFWEGFDAPGSTLKCVAICKLPFTQINDPLNKERAARESNSWFKYTLPASIIETKQAVGRLIRKANDRGYIVFADSRLVQKNYGNLFIDSMPSKSIIIESCNEIVYDVSKMDY